MLETPNANLVSGMAWLQSTHPIRLNQRHELLGHVLSGWYKAPLVAGSGSGYTVSPMLAQTGTLPASARTIEFLSNACYAIGFDVSFRGQGIALCLLGTTSNGRYVWGGDISAYAGQTGELSFLGTGYLDHIQFSNEPIPEPGVFALSTVGVLLLGWRALRGRGQFGGRRRAAGCISVAKLRWV